MRNVYNLLKSSVIRCLSRPNTAKERKPWKQKTCYDKGVYDNIINLRPLNSILITNLSEVDHSTKKLQLQVESTRRSVKEPPQAAA